MNTLNDPEASLQRRDTAAAAALPYIHPRLQSAAYARDPREFNGNGGLIDITPNVVNPVTVNLVVVPSGRFVSATDARAAAEIDPETGNAVGFKAGDDALNVAVEDLDAALELAVDRGLTDEMIIARLRVEVSTLKAEALEQDAIISRLRGELDEALAMSAPNIIRFK